MITPNLQNLNQFQDANYNSLESLERVNENHNSLEELKVPFSLKESIEQYASKRKFNDDKSSNIETNVVNQ